MGFVDLHSHVLWGLDDGAKTEADSRAMLSGLADLGFSTVCATPHQRAGMYMPAAERIRERAEDVRALLPNGLRLVVGAENMWDAVFYERSREDTVPSYDNGPAFLFELSPLELPPGLTEWLFETQRAGKLPVLAHPERYQPLWGRDDLLAELSQHCALVPDLAALAGHHGRDQAKAARYLLKKQLAHAVASDVHTPDDLESVAAGMRWIEKKLGRDTLTRLLSDNPSRILAGDLPG